MNLLFAVAIAVVTAYAPSADGTNCDGNCAVTASGYPPQRAIAACGSRWQMGDMLHVYGYGTVFCGDRFGANVRPNRVDVWFPDLESALEWGVVETEVTWLGHVDLEKVL